MFTPKLWEAKWIVDEVSCNFQCFNDAKNDHKSREGLKEASIHFKMQIILKSHLASSFGNVRLLERKITTKRTRAIHNEFCSEEEQSNILTNIYSLQYMELLRNEEELTSVQVSRALWQSGTTKKAKKGSSYLFWLIFGHQAQSLSINYHYHYNL